MTDKLKIGLTSSGKPFELPVDYVVQTFAILAIRGAGKTTTATVIAEEMCKAGLPWICFDPVGVWWGLRATAEGLPGGYPVVVIGGDHSDVDLIRNNGKQLADALMSEPICAVIDLSRESKRFWHTFLTDFTRELMELNPDVPRHIFIEEAPEFVPQRTSQELTARCKEAVERLIRMGRNQGYGCTLISQRPARVDKDVLSQCENLFCLRTTGKHDRKALVEWIEAQASDAGLERFLKQIGGLDNGEAFFWSPHWIKRFEKVRIRQRETFHPGATREAGKGIKAAALCDVKDSVARLKDYLNKPEEPKAPKQVMDGLARAVPPVKTAPPTDAPDVSDRLRETEKRLRDAEGKLAAIRKLMKPQHDALQALFGELGTEGNGGADMSIWEPWLKKAGKTGAKRMLEVMIERSQVTRAQLSTLAAVTKSTFNRGISFLKRNGLVTIQGDAVKLNRP